MSQGSGRPSRIDTAEFGAGDGGTSDRGSIPTRALRTWAQRPTIAVRFLERLRRGFPIAASASLLLIAACGGAGSTDTGSGSTEMAAAPGTKSTSAESASGNVDACALLRTADPAGVLGEPTDAGTMLWESHAGAVSVSQCQVAATGSDRRVGLLVRRETGSKAPASRQALVEATRGGDAMGVGDETASALEAGTEIPGLGDFAIAYELISYNLMVWEGPHQLTVMLDGLTADEAEPAAVQIARSVLLQL